MTYDEEQGVTPTKAQYAAPRAAGTALQPLSVRYSLIYLPLYV
jgi:hypothetical protein